ncbi:MAG: dynamin family protein [Desulfobacteraceae bacterium]|nr:dynamin family protein [Desulfobacteraceae bacterium]
METHQAFKEELIEITRAARDLLETGARVPGIAPQVFAEWAQTTAEIRTRLSEEILRVAVVGPIKSGKSTFVNALFGGDYLKRGAGVVTSIVTRIRAGRRLRATLTFKSWEAVNADIAHALALIPDLEDLAAENGPFDLRRGRDRAALTEALGALGNEQLITNDARNVNFVVLSSYLKGYERVAGILVDDTVTRVFEGERFATHRDFVGDEALAGYLTDVSLEITAPGLDETVEFADCQGSDAPNPLHLAMIQDYLLLTHLIIYVISSRTGLRQADIKFLSIIRRMGILENIVFVVNCDFNEHDTPANLEALVRKTREELALLKPDPEVFTFSALYNLFKAQAAALPEKDRLRLAQWQAETGFSEASDAQTAAFMSHLREKLSRERHSLLLQNELERLAVVAAGLNNRVALTRDLLGRDAKSAEAVMDKIGLNCEQMARVAGLIRSTLDGAAQKIKAELRNDVDRLLDPGSGPVVTGILGFIRKYALGDTGRHLEAIGKTGFNPVLYTVFQEFKQALDGYMAESVNPEIIRFVRELEVKIRGYLESVAGPYDAMVQDALTAYGEAMDGFGIRLDLAAGKRVEMTALEAVKKSVGLSLPPAVVGIPYSAKIKTEATVRLGLYRMIRLARRLLKRPLRGEGHEKIRALEDGLLRLKRETEAVIRFHFKDYRENLKYQYLFKLVDALAGDLYALLMNRFQAYTADSAQLAELIGSKQSDKQTALERLGELAAASADLNERIARLRAALAAGV